MEKRAHGPQPTHLVKWLMVVDKPLARDLEVIGKLHSLYEALSTLDCGKLHFFTGQCHSGNGHLGLETDVNCWPSNHLGRALNCCQHRAWGRRENRGSEIVAGPTRGDG